MFAFRPHLLLALFSACTSTQKPADDSAVESDTDTDADADTDTDTDVPVDTTAPSVQLISPADGAVIDADVVGFEAEASDDVGVVAVTFRLDGSTLGEAGSEPWTYDWDATSAFNGNYVVEAIARDAAGNEATATASVTLDRDGAPAASSLQFVNPADGATICGTVTVEALPGVDVASVALLVDGVEMGSDADAPYTWDLDTTTLSNGVHALRASASAPDGGGVQRTISVDVENTGAECDNLPSVVFSSPEDGGVGTGTITLAASAADDSGVLGVQFFVDSGLLSDDTSIPYAVDWDTSAFAEGPHAVLAVARDTAGQTAEARLTFTVDRTAPTVTLTAPSDGEAVSGSVSLSADATDDVDLASVTYQVDGVDIATIDEAPYTTEWDSTTASWGAHTLTAVARDRAGNTASDAVLVTVDNPPAVSFTSPLDGEVVSGLVTIDVSATDDEGVTGVEAWLDGVSLGVATATPYTFSWDTCELEPGAHTLSAHATDASGNTSTASVAVTNDQPLSVELDGPGTEATSTVAAWVVDDDGDVSVVFDLDGVVLATIETGEGSGAISGVDCVATRYEAGAWGDLGVTSGTYTLTATATNTAGDVSSASVVVTIEADADGDGFDATSWGGDDCDDDDFTVYPGALEVSGGLCDGVDNDCDGAVDEDLDLDGDGAYASSTCSAPYDCDDSEATVYTGATEVCGDGIDQDCSTASTTCGGIGELSLGDAFAEVWGDSTSDYLGNDITAGDLDGDGWPDLVVSAENDDDGGTSAGAAWVVFGPSFGIGSASDYGAKMVGDKAGDGVSAVTVGDIDGDGIEDLVLGARYEDQGATDAGAVYLLLGPITGDGDLATRDAKRYGEDASDYFGNAVAAADVDGDGYDDVLAGARGSDDGGSAAGGAYLVYGPLSGTADIAAADATFIGEAASDAAGYSVATGDLDGDGAADVVVGANAESSAGHYAGAVYLFEGAPSGDFDLSTADAKVQGKAAADDAGHGVATADLDGDGHDDLLVGAIGNGDGGATAGAVFVVLGPVSGTVSLAAAGAELYGAAGDHAGANPRTTDYDGDGVLDIVVGAHFESTNGTSAGAGYVTFGPVSGARSLATADVRVYGTNAGDQLGQVVGGADVNLDGFGDILIAAAYGDDGGSSAGAAYLLLGGPGE